MPSRRGSSSSDEDFELVELDSESQKHAAKVAKSCKELEALTISSATSKETDGKLSQSELEHELELSRKQVAELREENSQIRRQLEDLLTKADGRDHVEQTNAAAALALASALEKCNETAMKILQKKAPSYGFDIEKHLVAGNISMAGVNSMLEKNTDNETTRKLFMYVRNSLNQPSGPSEVINSGVLDKVVKAFEIQDDKLRFEAAWIITNIVSGDSELTLAAVNAGVVKPLVDMCRLGVSKLMLVEQALWALSNIAGDSALMRDLLIANDIVSVVVTLCSGDLGTYSKELLETLAWMLTNLCRHKSQQAKVEVLKKLVPSIAIMLDCDNVSVQVDACYALEFLSSATEEYIELAVPLVPKLFLLLSTGTEKLVRPSLRVLGNFATASNSQTQIVIDNGILELLPVVLKTANSKLAKECFWIISNILAGTTGQIQAVIDANLLPILFNTLKTGEFPQQCEAGWGIANLVECGTANQIMEIVRIGGAVETICQCLSLKINDDFSKNLLATLQTLLSTAERKDPGSFDCLRKLIEQCGGLAKIMALQASAYELGSDSIYIAAKKLIETHFLVKPLIPSYV